MTAILRSVVICLALLLAAPVAAQTARVTAGEHQGFTRLVVAGPAIDRWQVGRTADGYGLRLEPAPRFDLSEVFRLIGRTRLGAIWLDPQDGLLRLRVACDCHALAFQGGPGVLVVDLKDGPAPAGSTFESALVAGVLPALRADPPIRPRARPPAMAILGSQWAQVVWQASRLAPAEAVDLADDSLPKDNGTLLKALTTELARGAARGLVEFAPPTRRSGAPAPADALPAGIASRLGGMPGLAVVLAPDAPDKLTADGQGCLEDARVAVGGWGDDRPVWQQLAEATALPGEFDRPDAERRNRAIRLLLHLGFGLEARRLVEAMPLDPGEAADDPVYLALAGLVDGAAPAPGPFAGQAGCNGDVALWALLADPGQDRDDVNAPAVRRAFSALPLHLRRLLGPTLVDRFLALEDPASAEDVQAAMERVGGALPAEVAASAAELALQTDRPEAALEAVSSQPETGPSSVEVLVAEVEASVRLGRAVPTETVEALGALLAENRDGPDEGALRRALVLAQAASGEFGAALASVSDVPGTAEPVWAMLARAEDDLLLAHAVGATGSEVAALPDATRRAIAGRLVGLGLGPAAQSWLGDPPLDATLGAGAALLSGDARAALRFLSGADGEEASALRQAALAQLAVPGSDLPPGPWNPRLAAWTGDWERVALDGDAPWKTLAGQVIDETPTAPGPLAQGNAVLERATAAASAIADLRAAAD